MPSLLGVRQRRPVRATPAAISDPAAFTAPARAAAGLGGAIAGAGFALGDIQRRRNIELAQADFTAMKADTAAARNEFLQGLRTTDDDYNTINKKWGAFKKKTFKTIGNTTKQRQAQRVYGNWARSITPQWDRDIDEIAWGVSVKRAQVKIVSAGIERLRNEPDYDVGLLAVGMDIEGTNLLTSEQKDTALAEVVIATNPQWYLDNVDAPGTRELFELLSPDQKRSLETKAHIEIARIRAEQQFERGILETETRKAMSLALRENRLTPDLLDANRMNMAGSDVERYDGALIDIVKKKKALDARLADITDIHNRDIVARTHAANTPEALDAVQDIVNDMVSVEQRKISVEDHKTRTAEIVAKRAEFIISKANSYPAWSRINREINQVREGTLDGEIVRRNIDRAVLPAPGETAELTPELGISLNGALDGAEKSPAVKQRKSVTRAHTTVSALIDSQVRFEDPVFLAGQKAFDLESLEGGQFVIAVLNSGDAMHNEIDAFADANAGAVNFDEIMAKKLQQLTRPIIEQQVLGFFERGILFTPTRQRRFTGRKLELLEAQPVFGRFTAAEQQQAISLIEGGSTVEEAITQVERGGIRGGITATNPTTGETRISFDGGKTWQPL